MSIKAKYNPLQAMVAQWNDYRHRINADLINVHYDFANLIYQEIVRYHGANSVYVQSNGYMVVR